MPRQEPPGFVMFHNHDEQPQTLQPVTAPIRRPAMETDNCWDRLIATRRQTTCNEYIIRRGNDSKLKSYSGMEEEYVTSLMEQTQELLKCHGKFKGRHIGIGSFFERTKIKAPDEFDYLWESSNPALTDCVRINKSPLDPSAAGGPGSNLKHIFDIRIIADSNQFGFDSGPLDASQIQAEFHAAITETFASVTGFDNPVVKQNGPAASLYLERRGKEPLFSRMKSCLASLRSKGDENYVKLDVTFAIPVELPLQLRGDWYEVALDGWEGTRIHPVVHRNSIKAHFVPHGRMWLLSFAETEMNLLSRVPDEPKLCLMALKVMKSEVVVTNKDERTSLSSYPLKVAFLREYYEDDDPIDDKWHMTKMFDRATNILSDLHRDNATSFILRGEPLFPQYDRSFLEISRLFFLLTDPITPWKSLGLFAQAAVIMVFTILFVVSGSMKFTDCYSEYVVRCTLNTVCFVFATYWGLFSRLGIVGLVKMRAVRAHYLLTRGRIRQLVHIWKHNQGDKCAETSKIIFDLVLHWHMIVFSLCMLCTSVVILYRVFTCVNYIRYFPYIYQLKFDESYIRRCTGLCDKYSQLLANNTAP